VVESAKLPFTPVLYKSTASGRHSSSTIATNPRTGSSIASGPSRFPCLCCHTGGSYIHGAAGAPTRAGPKTVMEITLSDQQNNPHPLLGSWLITYPWRPFMPNPVDVAEGKNNDQ